MFIQLRYYPYVGSVWSSTVIFWLLYDCLLNLIQYQILVTQNTVHFSREVVTTSPFKGEDSSDIFWKFYEYCCISGISNFVSWFCNNVFPVSYSNSSRQTEQNQVPAPQRYLQSWFHYIWEINFILLTSGLRDQVMNSSKNSNNPHSHRDSAREKTA